MSIQLASVGVLAARRLPAVVDPLIANVIYLANFADIADSVVVGDRHEYTPQIGATNSKPATAQTVSKVLGGELVHPTTADFNFLDPADEPLLDIGTGDMCAEGWFEEDTANRTNFRAYLKQYTGSPNKSWIVQPDGSAAHWSLSQNGNSSSYTSMGAASYPVANTYTHLAFVKVGTSFAWYVNGVRRAGRVYGDLFQTNQPFATQARGKWKSVRYTAGNSRYGYNDTITLPPGADYDYRFPLTA